jgi:hypothetical protein
MSCASAEIILLTGRILGVEEPSIILSYTCGPWPARWPLRLRTYSLVSVSVIQSTFRESEMHAFRYLEDIPIAFVAQLSWQLEERRLIQSNSSIDLYLLSL